MGSDALKVLPVAVTVLPRLSQLVVLKLKLYCSWYFWPVTALQLSDDALQLLQ